MSVSKARRLAFQAYQEAAKHAGTRKGDAAAEVCLAMALLELSHQIGRLSDQLPVYGPPEER